MPRRAFSLVEVVLAVGVFAGAITVILALLPALTTRAANSADALIAQRMPDALRVEMQRLAATGGFDALATRIPVMHVPLDNGFAFVATRDAARLHARDYLAPGVNDTLEPQERYFLIEIWRFPSAPLAYEAGGVVLPVVVRVSWPYQIAAASSPVALADRAAITFTLAINR